MLFNDRERRALATVTDEQRRKVELGLPSSRLYDIPVMPFPKELQDFYVLVVLAPERDKKGLLSSFEKKVRLLIPKLEKRRFSVCKFWRLMYEDTEWKEEDDKKKPPVALGVLQDLKGAHSPV